MKYVSTEYPDVTLADLDHSQIRKIYKFLHKDLDKSMKTWYKNFES